MDKVLRNIQIYFSESAEHRRRKRAAVPVGIPGASICGKAAVRFGNTCLKQPLTVL